MDAQIGGDVRDRPLALHRQTDTRAGSAHRGTSFLAAELQRPFPPGQHPGIKVSAKPGTAQSLLAFVAELPDFAADDPRNVTATVARRLAQLCDQRLSAAAAGELRTCVGHLTDDPLGDPDRIDEIRAKWAARKLEMLLNDVQRVGGNGRDW